MSAKSLLSFCLFLCLCGFRVQAQESPLVPMHNEAVKKYYDGDYQAAVAGFLKLLTANPDNGSINYNLANAYFKAGELGKAIQYYEKARLMLPRDPDLKTNLRLAQAKQVDKITEGSGDQIYLGLYSWASWVTLFEYQIVFAFMAAIIWLWCFVRFWRRQSLFGWPLLMTVILYVYLGFGLYQKSEREVSGHYAIIVKAEAEARSSYLEKEKVLFTIHEGTKVRVIDTQFFGENAHWLKIRLPRGETGWIHVDDLGMI